MRSRIFSASTPVPALLAAGLALSLAAIHNRKS